MEYSSSISALSLFSQTKPQTSRALQQQHGLLLLGFSGSKTPLSINKTLFHQSLSPYLGKLQSPFLHIPISNSHKTQCFNAPQSSILRKNAEKVVILLVGSLLFVGLGKFGCKPCLAVPNSVMKEKMDTQSGKSDDEEMWLKLLEKNPSDVEALKVVLYGKMRRGKTKESIEYVERLIDIEPDEVEWRLLQALAYEMVGYLSKAKRLFKDILKERPLLLRALHGLVLVMHKNHEGPAAFEMLNKALEVACREKRVTEERNIRILIAQMLVVKGDLEEGLKKFQDLVNDNPRDFRPYLCQGIIYSLLDKKKEAEEQFETYHSLVPHEFPQRGFLDDVLVAAKNRIS